MHFTAFNYPNTFYVHIVAVTNGEISLSLNQTVCYGKITELTCRHPVLDSMGAEYLPGVFWEKNGSSFTPDLVPLSLQSDITILRINVTFPDFQSSSYYSFRCYLYNSEAKEAEYSNSVAVKPIGMLVYKYY